MGQLALPLAIAAFSATATYAQASSQNKAIRKSAASARLAGSIQTRQVNDSASLERTKRQNEAERIRGRLRVAAAAAGLGIDGGSYGDLLNQANYDAALNQTILERNRQNEVARIQSGTASNLAQLAGHLQNLVLASVTGGMQGFSTGMQIGSAVPPSGGGGGGPNIGGAGGYPSYGNQTWRNT